MARFMYSSAGAAPSAGAWTAITSDDLQLNAQSYTTFNLAASAVEGYAHRINIGADVGGVSNTTRMAEMGILYFDTGISLDSLNAGEGSNGVIQLEFEPAGVDNTSVYYTDTARPQTVMLWCGFDAPPFVSGTWSIMGMVYSVGLILVALIMMDTITRPESCARRARPQRHRVALMHLGTVFKTYK